MSAGIPPLGLCSWCLENTDRRVPAVTLFEGTALCASCNSRAQAESDDDSTLLDRVQGAAEEHAAQMLAWIRSRPHPTVAEGPDDE
jgi:hypothetical protein